MGREMLLQCKLHPVWCVFREVTQYLPANYFKNNENLGVVIFLEAGIWKTSILYSPETACVPVSKAQAKIKV